MQFSYLFLILSFFIFSQNKIQAQDQAKNIRVGVLPIWFEKNQAKKELVENSYTIIKKELAKFSRIQLSDNTQSEVFKQLISIEYFKIKPKVLIGSNFIADEKYAKNIRYGVDVIFCVKVYDVQTNTIKFNQLYNMESDLISRKGLIEDFLRLNPNSNFVEETIKENAFKMCYQQIFGKMAETLSQDLVKAFPFKLKINPISQAEKRTLETSIDDAQSYDIGKYKEYEFFTYKKLNINNKTVIKLDFLGKASEVKQKNEKIIFTIESKNQTTNIKKRLDEGINVYCSPLGAKGFLDIELIQATQTSYCIAPFSQTEYIQSVESLILEEICRTHLVMEKKIKVVERKKLQTIMQEREAQKYSNTTNSELLEQGKSIGADYFLTGDLRAFQTIITNDGKNIKDFKKLKQEDPNTSYYTGYDIQFKNIEVATGIINETNLTQESNGAISDKGFKGIYDQIQSMIVKNLKLKNTENNQIPIKAYVLEVNEKDKKNNPKIVTIDAGDSKGVFFYENLTVSEIILEEIDGKKMERLIKIATLKYINATQEKSTWEIIEGEKKFAEKLNGNKKIVVTN